MLDIYVIPSPSKILIYSTYRLALLRAGFPLGLILFIMWITKRYQQPYITNSIHEPEDGDHYVYDWTQPPELLSDIEVSFLDYPCR
jgi:hypothetical protein